MDPSFVYIYLRGVRSVCVQKEDIQYDGFSGSQAAEVEDQARECISLWCFLD